ncbi:MAG: hypothetical protein ABSE67_13890 [Xanthobacteraceae bacterium]|jgi:plasmid maintenance system antidote protein VapI
MNLYLYDIGEKARTASRFIGQVRAELQKAWLFEKAGRKITQQQIATMIGVNRSVINRQLMGFENLTLRRVAELAWALGWEIVFVLRRPQHGQVSLTDVIQTGTNVISFAANNARGAEGVVGLGEVRDVAA